jgi:hypothetical protein
MVENSGFQITRSFAFNNTNPRVIRIFPTFTGSGDGAAPVAIQPTFTPSASISNAYGQVNIPIGNPDTGVLITNLHVSFNRITTGSLAGLITNAFGHEIIAPSLGSIKPTNITGMRIENQGFIGVTTTVGLDISAQTGSTTNIGLRIAKGNTYSLQLSDTDGTPAGGITFGTDANLYRKGADVLKTDDDLEVADEAYGIGWNGSLEVPTKNAVYDKIEALPGGSSTQSFLRTFTFMGA